MTRATPTTAQFVIPGTDPTGGRIHVGDNVRWTTRDGFREGRLIEWRPGGAAVIRTRGTHRVIPPHRVRTLELCPDQYNHRRLTERGEA